MDERSGARAADGNAPGDEPGARTVFVDAAGRIMGEVPKLFVPVYEGMLFELEGSCVTVLGVEWDLERSATCRLQVEPTPAELLEEELGAP